MRRPSSPCNCAARSLETPTLERLAAGGYRTRIRFGKERRRFRILLDDLAEAEARALVLVAMGEVIGAADLEPELGAAMLAKARGGGR